MRPFLIQFSNVFLCGRYSPNTESAHVATGISFAAISISIVLNDDAFEFHKSILALAAAEIDIQVAASTIDRG
ncbi:hypothetical protein [Burkholderia cepacia]|uniref:hypothetical protein n=1 Tax=Burkholderia cepacia TaxID=292 RepID=UPI00215854EB|nr:hypothetical protein [Burkholderia cepacia]